MKGPSMVELKLIHRKSYLYELFQNRWEQVQRLRSDNEEFKGICNDYEACTRIIDRSCHDKKLTPDILKEYRDLCGKLESEIAYYLNVCSEHHQLPIDEELNNV